ncbi:hypothetical protein RGQ29_005811 [Quercus rubra]|uniref:C2H2-type domain-containing protein n=1 Tax=Quercus rubra TaxID=3512 RepID=A0AAN7E600_QUERU|nr:hypothetical protein RGQ29_005811 [Quercus rubra]
MSLLGILIFALKFLDVLSWPFFALGYPLCASIRAIENNSNSDTKKLVTYWIVFSLISLFENAFLKYLVRLLFWPRIKLMIVCWLVVPQFDGAIYVYNHFIHPCLSMNPLVVIDEFNKWKEFLFKRENFLAQAERYINKNGPEALEELIATKKKSKKLNHGMEEFNAIPVMAKKKVEWSNSKEANIVQKDNKSIEVIEKKEVPTAKTENRTSATKEETAVAVATVRELPDIPMPKEVRKEWTCEICQLTVLSEKTLNLHLQGKKHKTTEALKAKNQPNIVPASTTKKTEQPIEEPQKTVSTKEWKHRTTTNNEGEQHAYSMSVSASTAKIFDQPSKEEHEKRVSMSNSALEQKNEAVSEEYYRCNLCNTNCTGENDLASHYNGRKHKARIQLHNKLVGIGQV